MPKQTYQSDYQQQVFSLVEFCARNRISKTTYHKLTNEGRGPRVMRYGHVVRISLEAEREWRKAMEAYEFLKNKNSNKSAARNKQLKPARTRPRAPNISPRAVTRPSSSERRLSCAMTRKKAKGPSAGDAGALKRVDDGNDRNPSRNPHRRLGGSFHAEEARIVAALRAAGWIVWDYEDAATHDEAAHFFGSGDLIQPRHSTAVRALRRAVRGEPIPPPSEPCWWWCDVEGNSEFFYPDEMPNTMPVEFIGRGADFVIEQTVSKTPPRGEGWMHCPDEHPQIWQRRREMFWARVAARR